VDRAQAPADRNVVIAVVDGGFTVKQLCWIPDGILLRSGTPGHKDILVSGDQELTVWGVVRWSIHQV
jgi:DNA polymerase V